MFQFNGGNPQQTQAKFDAYLSSGVGIAKAHGVTIDPSTLPQAQKESLAYLGYIDGHSVKGYDNWDMMTNPKVTNESFSNFVPRLQ